MLASVSLGGTYLGTECYLTSEELAEKSSRPEGVLGQRRVVVCYGKGITPSRALEDLHPKRNPTLCQVFFGGAI